MGLRNTRAICPNCGGKIHTQPKGLGHLTWANSGFLAQTGTECQHCGVALTGKVKLDNRAELATPETEIRLTASERLTLKGLEPGRAKLAKIVAKHGADSKQAKKQRERLAAFEQTLQR